MTALVCLTALVCAALLLGPVPRRLAAARWAIRDPHGGLAAWVALAVSAALCCDLALVAAGSALAAPRRADPGAEGSALGVLLVGAGVALLVWQLLTALWAAAGSWWRLHRQAAEPDPVGGDALVRVVVAHERAHLSGRHAHLVALFAAWRRGVPRSAGARVVLRSVWLLTEVLADMRAAERTSRRDTLHALYRLTGTAETDLERLIDLAVSVRRDDLVLDAGDRVTVWVPGPEVVPRVRRLLTPSGRAVRHRLVAAATSAGLLVVPAVLLAILVGRS